VTHNVGHREKTMLDKLKAFFTQKQQEVLLDHDLTLGVPVRMLDNNTGEQVDDELVYGVSKEELLQFLKDNGFRRTEVRMK